MNDVASASNNSLAPGMVKRQRDTFQTQGDTVCTDQKLGDAARHSPPLTQSCSRADAQTIMICCRGVHARNNECGRRKVQSCWRPVPSPVPQQSCKENSPTRHDENITGPATHVKGVMGSYLLTFGDQDGARRGDAPNYVQG